MNIGKCFALPIRLSLRKLSIDSIDPMATMAPLLRPQNCTIILEPDPHWPMEATSRAFQHRRYALLALRAPPPQNTAALQTKRIPNRTPSPTQPTTSSRSGPRETPQLTAA
jgi:hypothetical protein